VIIISDFTKLENENYHTYIWRLDQLINSGDRIQRSSMLSAQDCLWDTFDAAFSIASRGKIGAKEYPLYVKGIRDLRGHILCRKFTARKLLLYEL